MNVLALDVETMFLDFVLRAVDAGHSVKWFRDKPVKDGKGFRGFEVVESWAPHMKWAKDGLIVCSGNCKYTNELDRFRDLGFKIFSPTAKSAKLEIDRAFGMQQMEAAGIEVPHYETFKSLEEAGKYARKSDKCYVFKPLGDEDNKALTFVSCDPAEMVGWIDRQIARGMKLKGPCMLQEKIDMVAELGVSGWFGPEGFLPDKFQAFFEHKKWLNGDLGLSTGEEGTVTAYLEKDKLADEMLKPMEKFLLRAGHCGDFAIGCGIDKKGKAWPFEFTSRLGWPAFFIQMASHFGDPIQWMRDLLDGKDTLKVSYDVAIGVVMSQPKYPYNISKPEEVEGNPISGLDEAGDDVHPISVMIGKGPKMADGKVVDGPITQTAGEMICVVTGLGKTVAKAQKEVYATLETIAYPNRMYRTDIGKKVAEKLPKLHEFGYVTQMEP